jgi:hypothetical protein
VKFGIRPTFAITVRATGGLGQNLGVYMDLSKNVFEAEQLDLNLKEFNEEKSEPISEDELMDLLAIALS